jgi:hypothetical protein
MASQEQQRSSGVAIDLDRLEAHAESLFLTRFVQAVKKARGEFGRYLVLRAGDELAIQAADDGSADLLEEVRADPEQAGTSKKN